MQQRVALFMCFLIGLSVWILVISKGPKHRVTEEKKPDKCEISKDTRIEKDGVQRIHQPSGLNRAELLILEITRLKIKLEFLHYNFTLSGVRKLEDLLMEYGGTPIRSLIVSTWRSGASFLGDMVNVMSSNFYHYEPLLKYGVQQIRGPPYSKESTRYLKSMFQCDFNAMETYIRYWKTNVDQNMFRQFNPVANNRRLWNMCEIKDALCFNSYLVAAICKLFPFQSMKVVRFRLNLANDILEDKQLNVKVVLLVRDPRGVMEARQRFEPLCSKPDCTEPKLLCRDMVNDYVAAQRLSRKYPNRFMVVRYEELMLNIDVIGLQVIKFLRLGPSRSFREYLKKNGDIGLTISKRSVFRWLKDMDFDSIAKIQEKCKEAMQLWDYELAKNASHMRSKNFYPLQKHSVFPLPLADDDFDGTINM